MNTRKTIHKVYLEWDFKKEELWLNEMAAEGWALEHAAFCSYTFVRCEPGEYIIRMEMQTGTIAALWKKPVQNMSAAV